MKVRWQFHFVDWVGASQHGIMFVGARPRGRGPWLKAEQVPQAVRDFLQLQKVSDQGLIWTSPDFKSVDQLVGEAQHAQIHKVSQHAIKGWFEIKTEKPVLPPRIDVDLAKLRTIIRDMNEGRNLKSYYGRMYGKWTCPECGTEQTNEQSVPVYDDGRPLPMPNKLDGPFMCRKCEKQSEITIEYGEPQVYGRGCFDVISFGWKDADLDPEGCTGIEELVGVEGKRVVVHVSGHKTACDPTYESEWELTEDDTQAYSDLAHEIVCGGFPNAGAGEWTGDDWCLYFHEHIRVPVVHKNNVVDYNKTAQRIIRAAEKTCEPYSKEWAIMDESLDNLYKEIEAKYEGKKDEAQDSQGPEGV